MNTLVHISPEWPSSIRGHGGYFPINANIVKLPCADQDVEDALT